MQSQNTSSVSQTDDMPHLVVVASKGEATMPAMLAALDAAAAAGDQARAKRLITKIYKTMDAMTHFSDRDPV